jgi:flagellar hook-length control protein FliK
VVQTGETRDLISESLSRLRSLLGQQGITLGDASVEHQGSWGGRSQNEGSGTTNGSASARIDQGGIPGSGDDLPGSQELPGQSAAGSDGAVDYFA